MLLNEWADFLLKLKELKEGLTETSPLWPLYQKLIQKADNMIESDQTILPTLSRQGRKGIMDR